MASEVPNLGILNRFPREIRDIIWGYVCSPNSDQSSKTNSFASLRTCRRIYKELSAELYDNETLTIRVSPRYQFNSWLCFENSRGARWHVRDLEDARSRGFSNLPYKRLQQVKICVEATENTAGRDDAGQIICLHLKMRDVADIILQAAEGGLRSLNFDLVESERGKWYGRGMPKRTISQIQDVPAYIPEWDFTIVWLPFYRCRQQFPRMDLTQDVPRKLFDWLREPQNVETDNTKRTVKAIRERTDRLYAHLDLALDGVSGETADMLRLHRFSTWYSRGIDYESDYLRELERIWTDGVGIHRNQNDSTAIEKRYYMVHSMNPLRIRQTGRYTPIPAPFDEKPRFSAYLKNHRTAVLAAGGWDRDAWILRYTTGIKPWRFNTEGWRLNIFTQEGHEYLDQSDAFAQRFGGQASRFLAQVYAAGLFQ